MGKKNFENHWFSVSLNIFFIFIFQAILDRKQKKPGFIVYRADIQTRKHFSDFVFRKIMWPKIMIEDKNKLSRFKKKITVITIISIRKEKHKSYWQTR